MKLYQVIMGFILMTLLMGCEGNNNKTQETKFGTPQNTTKKSIESSVINGQVVIQQRVILPENAVVTVTLADTSIAELPALILSQKYYDTHGKQSPFPFELSYQKDEIRPNAHLAVRATVSVDGDLWFISNVESVVINNGGNSRYRIATCASTVKLKILFCAIKQHSAACSLLFQSSSSIMPPAF